MNRLSGKCCVVTGAGSGIGAAIARAFANEHANVIVTDQDASKAAAVADALNARHRRLDVTSEQDWDALAIALPTVDVVVNNAGITGLDSGAAHDPEHARLADWQAVHRVNLDGTFLGCRYAIKAMRGNGGGSIINISSRAGMVGVPAAAAYASSKAAIRNHTKSVALYAAQQGLDIRCNSVHPGAILTPIWDDVLGGDADREVRMADCVADTPVKRFGTPDEVAGIVVMLASDDSTYMTGAEVCIDGGLVAGIG